MALESAHRAGPVVKNRARAARGFRAVLLVVRMSYCTTDHTNVAEPETPIESVAVTVTV